jgi:hypothetical protein
MVILIVTVIACPALPANLSANLSAKAFLPSEARRAKEGATVEAFGEGGSAGGSPALPSEARRAKEGAKRRVVDLIRV